MSNKFKIKNIWTPEVSREEFAKTLKEWDSALSSFDTKINDLKDAINNVNAKIDGGLSSFDTKINDLKDAINNVNAKIDDGLTSITNQINEVYDGAKICINAYDNNYVFKSERKRIPGNYIRTNLSPASGYDVSNLEIGKLYFLYVLYDTATYLTIPYVYRGIAGTYIYLPQNDTTILLRYFSNNVEVFSSKELNNFGIEIKDVFISK